MIKLLRALSFEQRKLLRSKAAVAGVFVIAVLTAAIALAFAAYGRANGVKLSLDMMWNDSTAYTSTDPEKAAWELAELEKSLIKASESEKYAIESECASLTRLGGIASYCGKYSVEPDLSGEWALRMMCIRIFTPVAALFAAALAAWLFAGEYKNGTIRMLLSRPVTRAKIYWAKMITLGIYSAFLMLAAYAAASVTAAIAVGDRGSGIYAGYFNGMVFTTEWSRHCLGALLCGWVSALTVAALSVMTGTMTRSPAAAMTVAGVVTLVSWLFGGYIGGSGSPIAGMTLFSTLDLLVPLEGLANYRPAGFSLCAASVGAHLVIFLIGGYLPMRRDVA